MAVQDDERERELSALFGLDWDAAHQRHGVDAILRDIVVDGRSYDFEIEVKSSTDFDIGTARDFGMHHIRRWRKMLFVFGFYSKERGRPELKNCLCLTPVDMEPWLTSKEAQMNVDFRLAERVPRNLQLDDLFAVCGEKDVYTLDDAKRLHKPQYTASQYAEAIDTKDTGGGNGISQSRMLDILQERARYIAERGSTVNNPHITKTFLTQFIGTSREITNRPHCAPRIRTIAEEFIKAYPDHAAAMDIKNRSDDELRESAVQRSLL